MSSRDTDTDRTQTPPPRPAAPSPSDGHQLRSVMSFAEDLRKQTQTPGSLYSEDDQPPREPSPPVPAVPVEFAHLARDSTPRGHGSQHLSNVARPTQRSSSSAARGETPPASFNLDADLNDLIDRHGSRLSTAFNYGDGDRPPRTSSTQALAPVPLHSPQPTKERSLRANAPPPTQAEQYFRPTPSATSQFSQQITRKPLPAASATSEPQPVENAFEASYRNWQQESEAIDKRRQERRAAREQAAAQASSSSDTRLNSPMFPPIDSADRPSRFAPQYSSMRNPRSAVPEAPKRPSLSRRFSDHAKSIAKKTARRLSESFDSFANGDQVRASTPQRPSISAPFKPQHDNGPDNVFTRSDPVPRPAPELQRHNRHGPMNVMPLDTNQHLAGTAQKHFHAKAAFERSSSHSARTPVSTEPSPSAAANARREKKRDIKAKATAPTPIAAPAPHRVKTVGHPDRGTMFGDFVNATSSSEESSPKLNHAADFTPAQAAPETPATTPAPRHPGNATFQSVKASSLSARRTHAVRSTAGNIVNTNKPLPRTPSPASPGSYPSPLVLKGALASSPTNRPTSQITQQILDQVPAIPSSSVPQTIAEAHRINRMIDERPMPSGSGRWWDELEVIVDTHFREDGVVEWTAVHRSADEGSMRMSLSRAQWLYQEPDNTVEMEQWEAGSGKGKGEGRGKAEEEKKREMRVIIG